MGYHASFKCVLAEMLDADMKPQETSEAIDRPTISVESLFKSFDDTMILKNINFSVEEGNLISIIGPSGCGKSTLLRCMNYLETPDSGTISIAGTTISRTGLSHRFDAAMQAEARTLRSKVGMVFQSLNLFPHKTILENITLAPITVNHIDKLQAEAEALVLLKRMDLEGFAMRFPGNLSGGQAQRVAIARAMAMSPTVMLYDEPTSALDPALVSQVLNIMRDLHTEGMTQVVVTHEMRFAREASDKIMFVDAGEIVEISRKDEIFAHPKDDRTRKFLANFS
jgi:polar amino acid transport system ATP-binding protein